MIRSSHNTCAFLNGPDLLPTWMARQALHDADFLNNLSNVYRGRGCLDKAIESYHRAVALDRDNADLHFSLDRALLDVGALEEAGGVFAGRYHAQPGSRRCPFQSRQLFACLSSWGGGGRYLSADD